MHTSCSDVIRITVAELSASLHSLSSWIPRPEFQIAKKTILPLKAFGRAKAGIPGAFKNCQVIRKKNSLQGRHTPQMHPWHLWPRQRKRSLYQLRARGKYSKSSTSETPLLWRAGNCLEMRRPYSLTIRIPCLKTNSACI
jgi:hypothetical protein